MTEEIRPSSIFRPRRVRPLPRDGRKENDKPFRKKLADLAKEDQAEPRASAHRSPPEPEQEAQEADTDENSDDDPGIGRNLDIRT